MSILDEAARTHPHAWWWVKADGCDILKGLGESVNLDWSGDVDMNDGKLQEYSRYKERLAFIEALGKRNKSDITVRDLNTVAKDI